MKSRTFGLSSKEWLVIENGEHMHIQCMPNDYYGKHIGYREARADYRKNRENGSEQDLPREPFPKDGKYDWVEETEIANLLKKPAREGWSIVRYTEGPKDRAWMQEKDRNYQARLDREKQEKKHKKELKGQRKTHKKQQKKHQKQQTMQTSASSLSFLSSSATSSTSSTTNNNRRPRVTASKNRDIAVRVLKMFGMETVDWENYVGQIISVLDNYSLDELEKTERRSLSEAIQDAITDELYKGRLEDVYIEDAIDDWQAQHQSTSTNQHT